jgi:hypothetical protein
VAGSKAKVMDDRAMVLSIPRESPTHNAQGEHRSRLGPDLVTRDQAGKEALELRGIVFRGHEVTPRLFVKRR